MFQFLKKKHLKNDIEISNIYGTKTNSIYNFKNRTN